MSALSITADLEHLPRIRKYVLGRAREAGLSPTLEPKLDLVLEEVFINVANHAYRGGVGTAEIDCAVQTSAFCVTVRDWGPQFNPLDSEPPDVSADIDSRPIGGLGLLLVTTMTDKCTYARTDDTNELTFCFFL